MNKASRLIKRYVALILVLLFSIESFAAVVGDNDGAAFITKAEFDSLKNDFQSQLDRYNSSIDNKIDGAIASYLSGISVAKQSSPRILVDNYEDIVWVNDFWMKGIKRTFTGRTTYTEITDDWFDVSLGELRMNLRGSFNVFFFNTSSSYSQQALVVGFTYGATAGGVMKVTLWEGLPVWVMRVTREAAGSYKISDKDTPVLAVGNAGQAYQSKPHTLVKPNVSGAWEPYSFRSVKPPLVDVIVNSPSGDEILNLDWVYQSGGVNYNYNESITVNELDFPAINYSITPSRREENQIWSWANNSASRTSINNNDTYWSETDTTEYIKRGVSFQKCESESTARTLFSKFMYSMFGADNNDDVNLAVDKEYEYGENSLIDFSDSKKYGTVQYTITEAAHKNTGRDAIGETSTDTINCTTGGNKTGILQVPLWPQVKFGTLYSGNFKYNNQNLRMGQGFPLYLNAEQDGYLQVTFDYNVKDLLDDSEKTRKIAVDVKDGDFLATKSEILKGYKNIVDPNKTTEPITRIGRLQFDDTSSNAQLTIPVKKEQSVWLRLGPYDTSKGIYASFKDLSMKFITDN